MRRVKRRQTHPRRRQKQTRESISLHIPHRYGGAAAAAWTDACARVNQKATTTISHQQTTHASRGLQRGGAAYLCEVLHKYTEGRGGAAYPYRLLQQLVAQIVAEFLQRLERTQVQQRLRARNLIQRELFWTAAAVDEMKECGGDGRRLRGGSCRRDSEARIRRQGNRANKRARDTRNK